MMTFQLKNTLLLVTLLASMNLRAEYIGTLVKNIQAINTPAITPEFPLALDESMGAVIPLDLSQLSELELRSLRRSRRATLITNGEEVNGALQVNQLTIEYEQKDDPLDKLGKFTGRIFFSQEGLTKQDGIAIEAEEGSFLIRYQNDQIGRVLTPYVGKIIRLHGNVDQNIFNSDSENDTEDEDHPQKIKGILNVTAISFPIQTASVEGRIRKNKWFNKPVYVVTTDDDVKIVTNLIFSQREDFYPTYGHKRVKLSGPKFGDEDYNYIYAEQLLKLPRKKRKKKVD